MGGEHVYALVDVDAMYASCEQVLQPWLQGRPVVVLSNNDGCVIARSTQATQLGVAMGQPWFTVAGNPRMREVIARSAHFALYGDFSARLHTIIDSYTPHVQPYSIDECYLALPTADVEHQARQLRAQVDQWLGLPISIGIAGTRTLAHLATEHAKHTGAGVCQLADADQRQALLAETPVAAVWGIADRMAARLSPCGVTTAADLAALDPGWARRRFSVEMERSIRELRGIPCIPLQQSPPPRQQCLHSRHLGQPVTTREEVGEVAASFAATVARRLRRHHRIAPVITVQLSTGAFAPGPQISGQATHTLPVPTADTRPLARTAAALARRIWRDGYAYRRVTVLAGDLTSAPAARTLDDENTVTREEALTAALDAITTRYGTASIGLGRAGLRKPPAWAQRQHRLWPVSSTDWHQLPLVHCSD